MVDSYSIDEAAAVLGVRKRRIWELVARGVLAGVPDEGGGMRIFLQGRPVVSSTSQPDGHRETNGNGGGHQQPSFDATPFRELLTEFRNLTERYGQALLALGEARGEVAALRTRVELLEARVDLRLPSATPPFSWAQPPAASEMNVEREATPEPEPAPESEPAPEPETVASGPAAAPPEPKVAATDQEVAAPAADAPEASRQEWPSVASQTEAPRRGEGRGRGQGDARSAVAALGEALARAEDPSLSHLPGAEEAASAFTELQREVAAEQESTLHEPETTRFPDEPELTQPAPDEALIVDATQPEPPTDEPDHVMVAESVAASERLPDAFLADDALGTRSEPMAEAREEAQDASAEPDLEPVLEPGAMNAEVEGEREPEVIAGEAEVAVTAEPLDAASGVGGDASEAIESSEQTPWPAAPVAYSSEWDEPDWIAEEDIEEPLREPIPEAAEEPMSPTGVAPVVDKGSGERMETNPPFTEGTDGEPLPADAAPPSGTGEWPVEGSAIEGPTDGWPLEGGATEPTAQPIAFEAIEQEVQPFEVEAIEPEGDVEVEVRPIEFEAIEPQVPPAEFGAIEPEEVAAGYRWDRAVDVIETGSGDVVEAGAPPVGAEPEPVPLPVAQPVADLAFTAGPEAMTEHEGLPEGGPAVASEIAGESVETGALANLEQAPLDEPQQTFSEEVLVTLPSDDETEDRASFPSGEVPDEQPSAEAVPEPLQFPEEEAAQRSPWAELDREVPPPEAVPFQPSGELAADAGTDTSAGGIAAASVERGVEEEVMWLGGGLDEPLPSPFASGPPTDAQRVPTPARRVSPAEDQALSRLAQERGWDEDELSAIRSLLAQPAPSSGLEGAPAINGRHGFAEPQPPAPEVRPMEATVEPATASDPTIAQEGDPGTTTASEPGMAQEGEPGTATASEPGMALETEPEAAAAQLDDEAFDWEQGPAAWSPPYLAKPSVELPGAMELDEAMAQLRPSESPVRPSAPDEPDAEPEPRLEPASGEEPEASLPATESSVWAKASRVVPEPPAQATSAPPAESPALEAESEPPAVHPPSPPFVRPDDPDWLRGRRGPAATAYRRLRRLFPG